MTPLEPPDSHYLSAAIGWLELGNPAEAKAELDRIRPAYQQHPEVLEVRWLLCAEQKDWVLALSVAGALLQVAPDKPSGWLHRAYALRRIPGGSVQKAWEALLPAAEKFPKEVLIAYNLACYACQMNHLAEARTWLKKAIKIAGRDKVIALALNDADFEPLWAELREGKL